jgi:hypothetical protein
MNLHGKLYTHGGTIYSQLVNEQGYLPDGSDKYCAKINKGWNYSIRHGDENPTPPIQRMTWKQVAPRLLELKSAANVVDLWIDGKLHNTITAQEWVNFSHQVTPWWAEGND